MSKAVNLAHQAGIPVLSYDRLITGCDLDLYLTFDNVSLRLFSDQGAYERAATYLRTMRPIYQSLGRDAEWDQLVGSIREKHRNRPRFMEILDALEERTIVQSQRKRRS
mgnify:CR=1 FL=1